jgi:hypothetical protein
MNFALGSDLERRFAPRAPKIWLTNGTGMDGDAIIRREVRADPSRRRFDFAQRLLRMSGHAVIYMTSPLILRRD